MRLFVGQAFRFGKAHGNFLIPFQVFVIFRGGNDGHFHAATFRGFSDFNNFYSVGNCCQLVPIFNKLGVVGKEIVVADCVFAEFRFRNISGCVQSAATCGEKEHWQEYLH